MKLGFLVVLAVAVLVPSLSEGRIVSRCELRDKLDDALVLPRKLERFKERILAILICELSRRTHLNTEFVRIYGYRKTTTVSPTTPEPTTPELVTEPQTTRPVTAPPLPPTTRPPVTAPPLPRVTTISSGPINATRSSNRSRRAADSSESASSDDSSASMSEEEEESMESMMEEDENPTDAVDLSGEMEGMSGEEDSMSDSNGEESSEEGGKRKKRSYGWRPRRRWSLGFYGIFGLSDSSFCDSGYRSSRNKCNTSCDDFTNDDIMDDIACLVRTGLWRNFIYKSSWFCRRRANRYYFSKCE